MTSRRLEVWLGPVSRPVRGEVGAVPAGRPRQLGALGAAQGGDPASRLQDDEVETLGTDPLPAGIAGAVRVARHAACRSGVETQRVAVGGPVRHRNRRQLVTAVRLDTEHAVGPAGTGAGTSGSQARGLARR